MVYTFFTYQSITNRQFLGAPKTLLRRHLVTSLFFNMNMYMCAAKKKIIAVIPQRLCIRHVF